MSGPPQALPWRTRAAMFLRLFAVQGAWNYETMLGNGIAFAVEPALRLLPGGPGGEPYRAAIGRHSGYFNAHPYLASVAVGAIARAELSLETPERLERFRTACCGPLGSVGDRLVWAGWLPACSLIALAAFGLGSTHTVVVLLFLGTYNAGHVALRAWGLHVGLRDGLRVAGALGSPVLRKGPAQLARVVALAGGVALPLVLRGAGTGGGAFIAVVVAASIGALGLARLRGRAEGWRLALGGLTAFILFSAVR